MGIFGRKPKAAESNVDSFLAQKILLPQVFLQPVEGEEHLRVYGSPQYANVRAHLLLMSIEAGEPFWQGKVFLKCREAVDDKALTSKVFDVIFENKIIGEISEYDSRARELFDFELDEKYVGRVVIRADLIGNIAHLFVNPANRIS